MAPFSRILALAALVSACGPQVGASFAPLAPRTATVGIELEVLVNAAGAAADATFDYKSDLADLKSRPLRPTLTALDHGLAIFRWTPLATDLGAHTLSFLVVSGGVTSRLDMPVMVVPGTDPLTFREPVGDGTTLDRSREMCARVAILVDSTATTDVKLQQGALWNDNATIVPQGPLSGSLRFCPTDVQATAQTIFPFSIVASDKMGAMAEKRYTIVLAALAPPPPPPPPTCNTTAPTITTQPHVNITASGNLHVYATVDDPNGVFDATVYWATTAPPSPASLNLGSLNRVDMLVVAGGGTSVQFAGTIPNPVAGQPSGTVATVYYLLRATDNADAVVGCPYNTSFSPAADVYSFTVTAP